MVWSTVASFRHTGNVLMQFSINRYATLSTSSLTCRTIALHTCHRCVVSTQLNGWQAHGQQHQARRYPFENAMLS
ncbi:uncharacterized protein SPSK_01340 [Sporothrix schenckii 1099-18]|uniref:Uncharacterized protein n=1 Tax=Sporothrix schenckii 1099-18 TaxID=1397361 RepID=A0A0F2LV89_SPOSC|nr:uncharacterized protein SPSK_01340 [Sporothrix schenckii 1099-18]KJR81378.1 hypothetical protein SPSK_01340 [Sporothrix schenckii 1099-18]